jgi:penicillin amidase
VLGSLGPIESSADAEAARSLLAGFDGSLAAESAAALLYACFVRALAAELYRPILGPDTWGWVASGALAPTISLVRRWLGGDTWELLGMPVPAGGALGAAGSGSGSGSGSGPAASAGHDGGERRDRVLAAVPAALASAWAAAVKLAGPDSSRWRWGDVHQAVLLHPLGAAEGGPGRLPSVPMGGDADTLQAAGYGWRAGAPFTVASLSVYRQVVDLADGWSASFVIPGGASGDPNSPHFADQLAEWAAHRRIPMTAPAGGADDR